MMNPNRDRQSRVEASLQVWLQEAKGVAPKKSYYCELAIDGHICARTSAKQKLDICFWGEQFLFELVSSPLAYYSYY